MKTGTNDAAPATRSPQSKPLVSATAFPSMNAAQVDSSVGSEPETGTRPRNGGVYPALGARDLLVLQQTVGNRAVQRLLSSCPTPALQAHGRHSAAPVRPIMLTALTSNVIQRTAKNRIMERGWTAEEAEHLKRIFGGWQSAEDLVASGRITQEYYRKVTRFDDPIKKRIFQQLDLASFNTLVNHTGDAELIQLVQSGIRPASLKKIMADSDFNLENVHDYASAGLQLQNLQVALRYPGIKATIQEIINAKAFAEANQILEWLTNLEAEALTYLSTNQTNREALRLMSKYGWGSAMIKYVTYFKGLPTVDNNAYETIGTRKYRVGHFSLYHTIQHFGHAQTVPDQEAKSFWPLHYTDAHIRTVCQHIQGGGAWNPYGIVGGRRYTIPEADAGGSALFQTSMTDTIIDQMFPTPGAFSLTGRQIEQLKAVRTSMNAWGAW